MKYYFKSVCMVAVLGAATLLASGCEDGTAEVMNENENGNGVENAEGVIPVRLEVGGVKPGFEETRTRGVPGATTEGSESWAVGDSLMMEIGLYATAADNAPTKVVYTYLERIADSKWKLIRTGSYVKEAGQASTVADETLSMLITNDAGQLVGFRMPALAKVDIDLYYAPGTKWDGDSRTNANTPGSVASWVSALSGVVAATGVFTFDFSATATAFKAENARLRIYTGRVGDQVVLKSAGFIPIVSSTNNTYTNNTYTATTDANGNAYFYGITSGPLSGTTGNEFTVTLPEVVGADDQLEEKNVFTASGTETIELKAGDAAPNLSYAYAIDARFAIDGEPAHIKIDPADYTTDYYTFVKALTDAAAADKLVWVVKGAGNPKLTGGPMYASTVIHAINAALQDDAVNTKRITLSMPEFTAVLPGNAFQSCAALANISLPAATSIGNGAFSGCTALASISLPAATSIGEYAFFNCSAASISLPAATSIGNGAFLDCAALASISLPAATSIDGSAFQSCTALANISLTQTAAWGTMNLGLFWYFSPDNACTVHLASSDYNEVTTVSTKTWTGKKSDGTKFTYTANGGHTSNPATGNHAIAGAASLNITFVKDGPSN